MDFSSKQFREHIWLVIIVRLVLWTPSKSKVSKYSSETLRNNSQMYNPEYSNTAAPKIQSYWWIWQNKRLNKNKISHVVCLLQMLTAVCRQQSIKMYSLRFQFCKLLNILSWSDKTLWFVTRRLQYMHLNGRASWSKLQKIRSHSTIVNSCCLHTSGLIPTKSVM